jgi:hypothetical protein
LVFPAGTRAATGAASISAESAFDAGVVLTREGQFERALGQFRAAEAAGDRSARLYFNLGVVHYRLGRFAEARAAFSRAAQVPETADLARYNLGLVAMAADDRAEAARWFREVQRHAQEPSLRRLASIALLRVEGREASASHPSRRSLSILRGQDSNVILPVGTITEVPTSKRDEFLEARAMWTDAIGDAIEGLGYRVSGFAIEYDEVHEGDIGAIEAAIDWHGPIVLEAALGALAVDDKGYQRTLDVRAQVPLLEYDWGRLDLDGGWSRFDPLDGRAADLEGSRYAYGASAAVALGPLGVALGYRHQINDRFASALSPDQDRFTARVRLERGRWSCRLWARFTRSDYPSERRDEAEDWGLDVAYRLHRSWDLLLEGSRLKNRSTDDRFEFTSERAYLGLRLRF